MRGQNIITDLLIPAVAQVFYCVTYLYLPFSLSQELEEELKAKSAKLNELRKMRLSDDEENTEAGFISHTNAISQALTALTEQVQTLQ